MSTVVEKRAKTVVQPFGVEVDPPRNIDVIIQSIPGCRLRGSINAAKTVTNKSTGQKMIPKDQARHLGSLPPIPGMELHVNPAKLAYMVIDPLHEDEEFCEQIRLGLLASESPFRPKKLAGVPPQKGTLDVHRMKTLCREIITLISIDYVRVIKGTVPAIEDVNALPGKYLLNPGSRVHNSQPVFEEDYEDWVEMLTRTGGG